MCVPVIRAFIARKGWRIAKPKRLRRLLRMGTMTMYLSRLLQATLLAMSLFAPIAFAQTFKMPCEVEATIPAMEDVKIKPQKVVIEIQSMGKLNHSQRNGGVSQTQGDGRRVRDSYRASHGDRDRIHRHHLHGQKSTRPNHGALRHASLRPRKQPWLSV
jgi:hypothetical protein